ncbi:MAG: ELWxxDGT repeat protein [Spirosomataceae bacterium]
MHKKHYFSLGALSPLRWLKSVASIFFLACLLLVSTTSPLLAQTTLVKDIYAGSGGSAAPQKFAVIGSTLYFVATDATNGQELWKSDGTAAGTVLVKDINPSGDSYAANLTVMGNTLYFRAYDATNGSELWKSDGTAAGTVLVKDINPGSDGSFAENLTVLGSTLYFQAYDATNGKELWKSDGTAAGTVLVKDIRPGSNHSSPNYLTVLGSTLYFQADNGTNGVELWKSDGTAAGTVLVKDIRPGSGDSYAANLTVMGSTLYFRAYDATNGSELWQSDGTAAGTVLVKDIRPGSGGSFPDYLAVMGSTLYFQADDGTNGVELWKSDGTAAGTVLVKDILSGSNGSYPLNLTVLGSTLYFLADDATNGSELWKSDGTAAGTVLVKDINPGRNNSSPENLTVLGSTLYFRADDGTNGIELWKSDGTAAGTVLVKDIRPGRNGSYAVNLTVMGSTLYFAADDGTNGTELWKSEGVVSCPSGNTLYVNASVSGGTGDGSSWANAYASLSDALKVAHACNVVKTIKVAAGTYKPTRKPFNAGTEMTTTNGRDVTFHIPDGVTMEGGYNATTGSRDITTNVTILSGDFNNDDVVSGSGSTLSITGNTENAYHVVLASGSTGVTIDGFSIKGGYANAQTSTTVNGNAIKGYGGAGIYLHNGTNKIENNTLSGNSTNKFTSGDASDAAGGGIYISGGTNTVRYNSLYSNKSAGGGTGAYGGGVYVLQGTDNMISYNVVYNNHVNSGGGSGGGGGIYVENSTNNTISNNTLYGNYTFGSGGGSGAGISIYQGTNTISNNTLHDNTVSGGGGGSGGGINIFAGTNTISNNTLYNNTASTSTGGSGGGIYIYTGTNTISNNTLYSNTASAIYYGGGGGIYLLNSTNTLSNNIFWGNKKGSTPSATVAGADVYTSSSTDSFKNNLLQLAESSYTSANSNALGSGASGNIFNQDPLFVNAADPDGADNKPRTADDGLALQVGSPAGNAGIKGTGIPTTDITGAARTGKPDIGAYESIPGPTITLSTTSLTAFSACRGSASIPQSFTVSGSSLTANITLTAPTGFEVSTMSGSDFGPSVTLTRNGTSLANTTIYVRMAATATGTPSGNVTCTSTDADDKSVAVSGTVSTLTAFLVSGGGTVCNSTVSVLLSGSQLNVNYLLKRDNLPVGSPVPGTGNPLTFPKLALAGTYTIEASNTSCSVPMTGSASIVVVNPDANFVSSSGKFFLCPNATLTLSAPPQQNVAFEWSLGTSVIPNSNKPSLTVTQAGPYTLKVTGLGSCKLVDSKTIYVQVPTPVSYSASATVTAAKITLTANPTGQAYTWSGPSAFSSTVRNPVINAPQPTNAGVYTVAMITPSTGCAGSATVSVVLKAPRLGSSDDDNTDSVLMTAFPNPATKFVTVEIRLAEPSSLQLYLYNAAGQPVGTWEMPEETTLHRRELDLGSIKDGLYLIQAQSKYGKQTKRIVKME